MVYHSQGPDQKFKKLLGIGVGRGQGIDKKFYSLQSASQLNLMTVC